MCRILGVSPSGYFAWRHRPPSRRRIEDEKLTLAIKKWHARSRGTYGAPRILEDLREQGHGVGCKRVARLMRAAGLRGVSRRKWITTTIRDERVRPAEDLVHRKFVATAPDQLWVADITHIPTWAGVLYLAVVLDVFSRRAVGWAMATHMRTELVLDALDMALARRRPFNVVHHSDQGCQYTSIAFGSRCRQFGVRPSMGSVGDCYDNALAESFFATLETELIDRSDWASAAAAKAAVFEYIEVFYNRIRRHSSLGNLSPEHFEERYRSSPAAKAG